MKIGLGSCSLAILALISCGGTSGSSSVTGDSADALRVSPLGVAVMQFLDLVALRPDALNSAADLPSGITITSSGGTTTVYTVNLEAAGTGTLTGTVTVSASPSSPGPGTTYFETFNLTVAPPASSDGSTGTSWTYQGSQQVVTTPGSNPSSYTASVTAPAPSGPPMELTATGGLNKTYTYSASLTETWTDTAPKTFALAGTYAFTQTAPPVTGGAATVNGTVGTGSTPIVWDPAVCADFPSGGSLSFTSGAGGAPITVAFTSTCGQITISGVAITLGNS